LKFCVEFSIEDTKVYLALIILDLKNLCVIFYTNKVFIKSIYLKYFLKLAALYFYSINGLWAY